MNSVEQSISEYLDAIEQAEGHEARLATHAEDRGGGNIYLKRANDDYPNLVEIDELKVMTEVLHEKVAA